VIFTALPLAGAYLIEVEPHVDERGFFARSVCQQEFAAQGLEGNFVQQSVSWNPRSGTLRGLHYQRGPNAEKKLVRVTRGAVFDVIVDLRPGSPTLGRWHAVTLTADNHRQLYIPEGFAHGFQTLEANTEVFYQMTSPHDASASAGIRWNDSALGIDWPPFEQRLISERDQSLPNFTNQITA